MKATPLIVVAAISCAATVLISCESGSSMTVDAAGQPSAQPSDPSGLSSVFRGMPALTSGLSIPAQERFHLGERPTDDFIASVENVGSVPVDILLSRNGGESFVARLEPGDKTEKGFLSGDGVLFENPSGVTANLRVRVWGERNLAMYYTPLEERAATP